MGMYTEIGNILKELADTIEIGEMDLDLLGIEQLKVIIDRAYPGKKETADYFMDVLKEAILTNNKKMIICLLRGIGGNISYVSEVCEQMEHNIKINMSHLICDLFAKESYIENITKKISGNTPFHGRGAIYTVLTGNYEPLKEPEQIIPNVDYICFTDSELHLQSNIWQIRLLTNEEGLDSIRLSRRPKILFYEYLQEYDYSIYIDGKFRIIGDIEEYIHKFSMGASMLVCPHFARGCVYEEAEVCKKYRKDDCSVIDSQINRYRSEKFPDNYGLIEAGFMVRSHHDPLLRDTMKLWWEEYMRGSRRDQLSFPFACWKNNLNYDISGIYSENNNYISMQRGQGE